MKKIGLFIVGGLSIGLSIAFDKYMEHLYFKRSMEQLRNDLQSKHRTKEPKIN